MEPKKKLFEKEMYEYILEQIDSSIDKSEGWENRYLFMANLVIKVVSTFSNDKKDFLSEMTCFIETLTKNLYK